MGLSSTPDLRQDEITAILVDPAAVNTIGSNSQSALNLGIASAGSGLIGTWPYKIPGTVAPHIQPRPPERLAPHRSRRPGGNQHRCGKEFGYSWPPDASALHLLPCGRSDHEQREGRMAFRELRDAIRRQPDGLRSSEPRGEIGHTWRPK